MTSAQMLMDSQSYPNNYITHENLQYNDLLPYPTHYSTTSLNFDPIPQDPFYQYQGYAPFEGLNSRPHQTYIGPSIQTSVPHTIVSDMEFGFGLQSSPTMNMQVESEGKPSRKPIKRSKLRGKILRPFGYRFINYTLSDKAKLLKSVCRSGAHRTKARREKEKQMWADKVYEVALNSIQSSEISATSIEEQAQHLEQLREQYSYYAEHSRNTV